jgi:hypothetical protein
MAADIPTSAILEYCNHVMTCDSSLQMRRHVAQVLPESWLAAFGRGVINGLHQAASILEANVNPTQRMEKHVAEDIQCLREMLQADLAAKTIALGNLLLVSSSISHLSFAELMVFRRNSTPQTDLQIRLSMLTILNLMHAGRSEDPAKLRLTLSNKVTKPSDGEGGRPMSPFNL